MRKDTYSFQELWETEELVRFRLVDFSDEPILAIILDRQMSSLWVNYPPIRNMHVLWKFMKHIVKMENVDENCGKAHHYPD